jgi:hypothetical protein
MREKSGGFRGYMSILPGPRPAVVAALAFHILGASGETQQGFSLQLHHFFCVFRTRANGHMLRSPNPVRSPRTVIVRHMEGPGDSEIVCWYRSHVSPFPILFESTDRRRDVIGVPLVPNCGAPPSNPSLVPSTSRSGKIGTATTWDGYPAPVSSRHGTTTTHLFTKVNSRFLVAIIVKLGVCSCKTKTCILKISEESTVDHSAHSKQRDQNGCRRPTVSI